MAFDSDMFNFPGSEERCSGHIPLKSLYCCYEILMMRVDQDYVNAEDLGPIIAQWNLRQLGTLL